MHGVVDSSVCQLTEGDISYVIQMAWEDRTSFETIKERVLRHPEMKFNDHQIADHRRANC